MEFEAPSVWRIASKHTVTFHNLAALGLKRLAAIPVDLAEVDAETPTGTRRRLGQSLEKPWLSGAELKVRIQLPPAESQVRTCLSREFAFLRREAAVSRGCAASIARSSTSRLSARTRGVPSTASARRMQPIASGVHDR